METAIEQHNGTHSAESAAATDRLAVIVPVYNEERTVAELLRRLEVQPCVSQIIIVDDGSTDRSYEELGPWRSRVAINADSSAGSQSIIVLQHGRNRGKGRAIRTGLDQVTCSHVVIQDADLEYDPANINKLWAVIQSGEADVVYGSRYLQDPRLQRGRIVLQSGIRFLNLLIRLLYGVRLTDEATCYKMFRTNDLRTMELQCEQFEFCPEVTCRALTRGLTILEVGICYEPRAACDGKKLRFSDGLYAALRICSEYSSRAYFGANRS